MPIHRDARQSRRRRMLLEGTDTDGSESQSSGQATTRRAKKTDEQEPQPVRRSAGYSQDVRNACGQRLVQLIPIRRRSLLAVIAVCCVVPALLMLAHYMVYVSGTLPWYGHPLAISLDASHPQGLVAWLCSHLWLLCLGTTLLTFQLRRHKLDDYRGEYRLWFWLVITCLLGSLDSTTHISQLFATAMDPACRRILGWSGMAVMQSTVVVLVGMLGLRLCTELKVVPLSLCLWLLGLAAWAGSVALSRAELRLDLSVQFRIWMRCALWLSGLTAIWLSGLVYLRYVYIEAQRRFLLRGRLAASATNVPMAQRMRGAWEALPAMPRFRRSQAIEEAVQTVPRRSRRQVAAAEVGEHANVLPDNKVAGRIGEAAASAVASRPQTVSASTTASDQALPATGAVPAVSASWGKRMLGRLGRPGKGTVRSDSEEVAEPVARREKQTAEPKAATEKKSRWGWLRRAKDSDDAAEFRKIGSQAEADAQGAAATSSERPQRPSTRAERRDAANDEAGEPTPAKAKKRWLPRIPRPSMPKLRIPKIGLPKLKLPKIAMPKLPKIGFGELRLKPPHNEAANNEAGSAGGTKNSPATATKANVAPTASGTVGMSAVDNRRPLPGTSGGAGPTAAKPVATTQPHNSAQYDDDDEDGDQPMSKAERKRLRRQQQQNRAA